MSKSITMITILLFSLSTVILSQSGKPQYDIRVERADTLLGNIIIETFPAVAPLHSAYFDSLVNINFYDSTAIHRVVPEFVIQGGDPNSKDKPRDTWGEGDSNQTTILAEFSGVSHQRGIVGAARDTDINSANSQFYVNLDDNSFLDWNYTAYGQVLDGMDLVDFISLVPRDTVDNPNEKLNMFISKTGITNDIPANPKLTYPKNGELGILNLDTLKWEVDTSVVMYYLEISKSANFDSIFIDKEVGFNSHRLQDLQLGGIEYFWRVKANNGGNVSEYSDTGRFVSSIEAPILIYPEMNDDSISLAPEFRWYPVEGATKYRLQIATSPLFSDSRIVYDIDTITLNYHTPTPLEANRSHYWRVYSMTDEYQGPKSEFRRFVTPELTSVNYENLPSKFQLSQNYPNPFNPSTTIKYSIPSSSVISNPQRVESSVNSKISPSGQNDIMNIVLKVYDLLGREVAKLVNEKQKPGNYDIEFDAAELTSGIYFYKLEAGNFSNTKKMILLR